MVYSVNKYTLILLKDYANLTQVKLRPFTFWAIVFLFLLSFVICIVSVVFTGFLWYECNTLQIEKDSLYKKYTVSQAQLQRLVVLEELISKQPNLLTSQKAPPASISPTIEKLKTEEKKEKSRIESYKTEKPKEEAKKKEKPIPTKYSEEKQDVKKQSLIALEKIHFFKRDNNFDLSMNILNTSGEKQTGTIQYFFMLNNQKKYKVSPLNVQDNSYTITKMKRIKTVLVPPKDISIQNIDFIIIQIMQDTKIILTHNIKIDK